MSFQSNDESNYVSSFDICVNGFRDISKKLIEIGENDPDVVYDKYKKYFPNDVLFDDIFKTCFSIEYCDYQMKNKLERKKRVREE